MTAAQVFGDGLQVEHEVAVIADELAHLVHQEDDAPVFALFVQVLLNPLGKGLDGQAHAVLGLVKPVLGRLQTLAQGLGQGLDHFVSSEVKGVPLILPVFSAQLGKS